jgi:hypothetical protein
VQEEIFEVGAEGMSINELAERLAVNEGDIITALFMRGIMVSVNQVTDPPPHSPHYFHHSDLLRFWDFDFAPSHCTST